MRLHIVLSALLLIALPPLAASAQESSSADSAGGGASVLQGPLVRAEPRPAPIALDGRLDEDAWLTVAPATGFIQTEPDEGQPSREPTEVYILFDDDALYVGARLVDTGAVRSRLARRDAWISDSDWFTVMLDTHHDHQTAYEFSVNPAGVKRDQLLSGGRGDDSWDAVWEAATAVEGWGWSVELRIPFSQIRFPLLRDHVWGIQAVRRISRSQEVSVLAFTPRSERGGVATYGHLLGLYGLRQAERFELLPYALARAAYSPAVPDDPFRDGSDYFGGVGIDLKYRVTSALTLDATVNPDFGQVEVDPAVVNLSAYETSFEEKRPFFVEGSEILQFAGQGRGLYYSRRIGRAPQGVLPEEAVHADRPEASSIIGAAKLTARTQRGWSVGVLGAVTGRETAEWVDAAGLRGSTAVEPRTGYGVARLQRALRQGQTTVGGIATLVRRELETDALAERLRRTALAGGVDFTHEFLDRTWSIEGALSGSFIGGTAAAITRSQRSSARYYQRPDAGHVALDSQRTSLAGYAARLEIGKRAGLHWRGEASASATSPGYEINDLGFQNTVDRATAGASLTYVENAPGRLLRNWRAHLNGRSGWNYGGDLVDASASLRVEAQALSYWSGSASFTRSFDTYSDRLTRGGPLTRDPAGYNVNGGISSDGRRRVSGRLNANYSWGESGGWHQGTSLQVGVRPADNWSVSAGPRLDRSLGTAQYLGAIDDTLMTATFGRRFLFAPIRQTTWSMETRLALNLSPEFSIDVYTQPFVASGDYHAPRQLARPRSYAFQRYGRDTGTLAYDEAGRAWVIDPDGAGPAAGFTLADRDFTSVSLRGNAVLRWEWRPGSTLYLVWQQARTDDLDTGEFDLARGLDHMVAGPASDTFVLKFNYWLNL